MSGDPEFYQDFYNIRDSIPYFPILSLVNILKFLVIHKIIKSRSVRTSETGSTYLMLTMFVTCQYILLPEITHSTQHFRTKYFFFQGYVPLYDNFEKFYLRYVYRRVRDCWNIPICSVPGAETTIKDRITNDYGWTFE